MTTAVEISAARAAELDHADPLREWRSSFHFPKHAGKPVVYMTGNSLGLQPVTARMIVEQELKDWAELAVEAHFQGANPWFPYHEWFREPGARLVGAKPGEVVMMNSLTVNLHLMMATFYRPTKERFRILIESPAFPSDEYAVQSQARLHGFDPERAIVRVRPRSGETSIRDEDILETIRREGASIAMILIGGVNYATGQFFDLASITRAGHEAGCVVGFDLAHAAGNVPLRLHDWGVDFAAWCSYKYLNAGPGAIAGCFVHERHWRTQAPRLEGWWGNDPKSRFKMAPNFEAALGAEAWALSNPPILSAAPLRASLEIFDAAGMDALREKSLKLSGYLRSLVERIPGVGVLTPLEDARRGTQLSLTVDGDARAAQKALLERGVVADFREPNVIRVAPAALYCSYEDARAFAAALAEVLGRRLS